MQIDELIERIRVWQRTSARKLVEVALPRQLFEEISSFTRERGFIPAFGVRIVLSDCVHEPEPHFRGDRLRLSGYCSVTGSTTDTSGHWMREWAHQRLGGNRPLPPWRDQAHLVRHCGFTASGQAQCIGEMLEFAATAEVCEFVGDYAFIPNFDSLRDNASLPVRVYCDNFSMRKGLRWRRVAGVVGQDGSLSIFSDLLPADCSPSFGLLCRESNLYRLEAIAPGFRISPPEDITVQSPFVPIPSDELVRRSATEELNTLRIAREIEDSWDEVVRIATAHSAEDVWGRSPLEWIMADPEAARRVARDFPRPQSMASPPFPQHSRPATCKGCDYYVGHVAANQATLICAVHPNGFDGDRCPDTTNPQP